MLTEHGLQVAPSTYYDHLGTAPTARQQRDDYLLGQIRRVHADNYAVYGARNVWLQLNREGIEVARCTVERLMKTDGLRGAVHAKTKRTTAPMAATRLGRCPEPRGCMDRDVARCGLGACEDRCVAAMSVGEVAGRLGVSASTVRMWGSRYGLTASQRSTGGHRRFSDDDFARLLRMQQLVTAGTDPAAAAATVLSPGAAAPPARGRGGPGGAILALPGADPRVRGLARAAARLQDSVVTAVILDSLAEHGVLPTWNDLVLPVLVAAGEHWHGSGTGIEIEHLLTQAVVTALTSHEGNVPELAQAAPVVLAGGPGEDHVLTLHALRAALSERGVAVRFLGARTPLDALSSTVRLTRAPAVFIWATMPVRMSPEELATLRSARRGLTLAVGGPGWLDVAMAPATRCDSLEAAVALLEASWRRTSHQMKGR